jgi:hypothetical protein
VFKNAEELLNAPDDEEERRDKARRKRIRWACFVLALLLLAVIIGQKWPVRIPEYEKGQSAQLVYWDVSPGILGDTSYDFHITEDESQIQNLLNLLRDFKFYKKVIQPHVLFGVQGYTDRRKEMEIFISSPNRFIFTLNIVEGGTLTINGNDEYTVGLFNQDEQKFFSRLYEFYQGVLKNDQWRSGK